MGLTAIVANGHKINNSGQQEVQTHDWDQAYQSQEFLSYQSTNDQKEDLQMVEKKVNAYDIE